MPKLQGEGGSQKETSEGEGKETATPTGLGGGKRVQRVDKEREGGEGGKDGKRKGVTRKKTQTKTKELKKKLFFKG